MDAAGPDFPTSLVFVGGVPRSGTTITHALLCTAPQASAYTPEISFFRYLVEAYWAGEENWSLHTHGFFPEPDAFQTLMAQTARSVISEVWRGLGAPAILCLKDPRLTPYFPELARLLPEVRLVTVCRHPYAVIRSRQEVHERSGGQRPFSETDVREIANEYRNYYSKIIAHDFGGRNITFRYEDLTQPQVKEALAKAVGAQGFDEAALWTTASGERRDNAASQSDPSHSPKYSGGIDLAPRLTSLRPDWQEIARSICAPVMRVMQYH